jgi:metallophosphoesterase superfamily enzyme
LKKEKDKSKILIVAGDICDDLNDSINYLDHISQYYDKVLYVDGNHEHISQYP